MKKARIENFITQLCPRTTPPPSAIGALALAFVPPLVLLLMGQPARFGDWIYRALTFLVISCPCALVISIPLTFFGGIGGASKPAASWSRAATIWRRWPRPASLVFDKTGTLTKGAFKVTARPPRQRHDRGLQLLEVRRTGRELCPTTPSP